MKADGARKPLDAATALALLCARERVDVDPDGTPAPGRVERLRAYCAEVDDWDAFAKLVDDLRILPLAHRHLVQLAADVVPVAALDRLSIQARRAVLGNLRSADMHVRLHRDVLTPLGVPHLFLKGTTLAHRFYEEPILRVARDVDVLVPREAMGLVGHTLRELGHQPDNLQFGTDSGIRYSAHVLGEMKWYSPEGVLIEVHSALKYEAGRLPAGRLLADPDVVQVAGTALPALRLDETISYVCLHHTRSAWTRLHWVADLDAMLRATKAAPNELIASARTLGFGRVVAASLGLHGMLASPDPQDASPSRVVARGDHEDARRAEVLRDACLAGLTRSDAPPGTRAIPAVRRAAVRVALADLGQRGRAQAHAPSVRSWLRQRLLLTIRFIMPARWRDPIRSAYFRLRPSLRLPRRRFDPASARR